ncbi:MAG: efflux transporter outer membrane subunit, partial [Burkholderiales bacterium]
MSIAAANIAVFAAFLGGCAAVGPDYVEPRIDVPAAWSRAPTGSEELTASQRAALGEWWRELGDATLSRLIEQALQSSNDLRIAQARLREARGRRAL